MILDPRRVDDEKVRLNRFLKKTLVEIELEHSASVEDESRSALRQAFLFGLRTTIQKILTLSVSQLCCYLEEAGADCSDCPVYSSLFGELEDLEKLERENRETPTENSLLGVLSRRSKSDETPPFTPRVLFAFSRFARLARALTLPDESLGHDEIRSENRDLIVPIGTSMRDFEILEVLSDPSHSRVFRAREVASGLVLVIKVFDKSEICLKNMMMRVFEADWCSCPFTLKYYYAFPGRELWYLVMEDFHGKGRDMVAELDRERFFEVEDARRYFAEIVVAVEYLHTKGYCFRDLRPEKIIVMRDGHIRLIDFGLNEKGMIELGEERNNRIGWIHSRLPSRFTQFPYGEWEPHEKCPSDTNEDLMARQRQRQRPNYVAPEILLGQEQGFGVDWWSVGCLLFHCLFGYPPFDSMTPELTLARVLSVDINWPLNIDLYEIPDDPIDLVKRLIVRNVDERLEGEEIKRHPWLRDVVESVCGPDFRASSSKLAEQQQFRRLYPPELGIWLDEEEGERESQIELPFEDDILFSEDESLDFVAFSYRNQNALAKLSVGERDLHPDLDPESPSSLLLPRDSDMRHAFGTED